MKHPHVRGEDGSDAEGLPSYEETPPRAWGRLRRSTNPKENTRNTPTCVGKTAVLALDVLVGQKHPHVRGEDTERLLTFFIEPSKQY